ncbi:Fpg/Nei family DNA glycosylase [Brevibacterium album]|uniref:Fpg/Nei family DNA glycosylase n=1 Tax=Brevibacterium album TaxID=417948 RepID=UPI00040D5694|nr:DNA-formamidopyrimidine glycosylase family protein [Brevibacterium album]
MPEGHSVHRIAARLGAGLGEQPISVSSPQGRFASGAALLDGRTLLDCRAVGKQLFAEFAGDLTLRVHLGLYGAWDFWEQDAAGPANSSLGAPRRIRAGESEAALDGGGQAGASVGTWPPAPVGAVRVRLSTATLCADLRGPTACEVLTPEETAAQLQKLGPDPLVDGTAAGRRRFLERAGRRRTAIGALLMDQSVVAGIGNIYRAEMLFRAGVDPCTPGAQLGEGTLSALWDDWCRLLRLGIETGVILTRTGLRGAARERALAGPDERHFVYGREGLPCRECGTPVSMALMQNRKLFWCAGCQTG